MSGQSLHVEVLLDPLPSWQKQNYCIILDFQCDANGFS